MANNIFVEIEGIEGESKDVNHEKTIECESMQFSSSNMSTVGTGTTGHGSGNAQVGSIMFSTMNSKASPLLWFNCVKGTHFEKITVYLTKSDGDNTYDFQKLDLTNAYIDSFNQSSAGNQIPNEMFSIAFGKVEVTYKPQATDTGAAGADIVQWFDLEKHEAG